MDFLRNILLLVLTLPDIFPHYSVSGWISPRMNHFCLLIRGTQIFWSCWISSLFRGSLHLGYHRSISWRLWGIQVHCRKWGWDCSLHSKAHCFPRYLFFRISLILFNPEPRGRFSASIWTGDWLCFSEGKESSPKLLIRKFSPKLASFPWSSDSYKKNKNPDNTLISYMPTTPEAASPTKYEIQFPKENFCTINENSSELPPQW